jgi:hypothetical protein
MIAQIPHTAGAPVQEAFSLTGFWVSFSGPPIVPLIVKAEPHEYVQPPDPTQEYVQPTDPTQGYVQPPNPTQEYVL